MKPKLAVLGFCHGGGKAIRCTTQRRQNAATVIFYGMPVADSTKLCRLKVPVCGIYSHNDAQLPMPLLKDFQIALAEAEVKHDIKIYDGVGHAFWKNMDQVRHDEHPQKEAFHQCTRDFFNSKTQ